MPEPDPDAKVVAVAQLPTTEAHLLVGRLRAEGIQSEISEGKGGSNFLASAALPFGLPMAGRGGSWSEVLVHAADEERARQIVDEVGD